MGIKIFTSEMFFRTLDEIVSTWIFTKRNLPLTDCADIIGEMLIKAFS